MSKQTFVIAPKIYPRPLEVLGEHAAVLAFLAPNLVQAAVEGRLPRGIGVARLRDAPAEWSRQYAMLGLSG